MSRKLSALLVAGTLLSAFSGAVFSSSHGTWGTIGSAISPAASVIDRVIELGPETKYVNVTAGERVLFQFGGRSFSWQFSEGHPHPTFNLSEIAPNDMNVPAARIYVGENVYDHSD